MFKQNDPLVGKAVHFFDKGENLLGVVITNNDEGNQFKLLSGNVNYQVLSEKGEKSLHISRLQPLSISLPAKKANLISLKEELLALNIDVGQIWKNTAEGSYTAEQLADSSDPKIIAATIIALANDKVYFEKKDLTYTPRQAEKITTYEAQERQSEEEIARLEQFLLMLSNHFKNKTEVTQSDQELITKLIKICSGNFKSRIDSRISTMIYEFFKSHLASLDVKFFKEPSLYTKIRIILEQCGILKPDYDYNFIKFDYDQFHSHEIRLCASNYEYRVPESKKLSLTEIFSHARWLESQANSASIPFKIGHLSSPAHISCPFFSIDDVTTKDIDDACAYIEENGKSFIIIKIARVDLDAPLSQYAAARGSSVYTIDNKVNMLPDTLAEEILSLKIGQKVGLSWLLELEDGDIRRAVLAQTVASLDRNLNYDEVDMALDRGETNFYCYHELDAIKKFTDKFCAHRLSQKSGKEINLPEKLVYPDGNGELTIVCCDENTTSRNMIRELMLCYNYLSALLADLSQIPFIFRSQEGAEIRFDETMPLIVQDYQIKSSLKKSNVAPIPGFHASIGLSHYCQVTSPIRRYLDIVLQEQLCKFLRQESLLKTDELTSILESLGVVGAVASIQKLRKKYWQLRYLDKIRESKEKITGIVLKCDKQEKRHFYLIALDLISLTLPLRSDKLLEVGSSVEVRINKVDFEDLNVYLAL